SAVCCMFAVKQAVIAREHSRKPLDCTLFFMDLRTQGKDFDRYAVRAEKSGVRFVRSRIHSVEPVPSGGGLRLRYTAESGDPVEETFDIVVLSTGLEIDPGARALADRLGVAMDADGFVQTSALAPVNTSVPGIFACGAFTGPKDIPHSVMEASAAAAAATEKLAAVRHSKTRKIQLPEQIDVSRQPPRIGVFVCNCGINIGGVVRVPEVARFARDLPGVVYVEENLFTCSQDTQDKMVEVIREKKLNRVVVAACTPRTHEALFQQTMAGAGLNKFLFEMANIRNHDSWVHPDDPDAATEKAKDLVRMAVAKAALLRPLAQDRLPITRRALVVGGGIAGMTATLALAEQGYPVDLVEQSAQLGGHGRRLRQAADGRPVAPFVEELAERLVNHPDIRVHLDASVESVEGFVGNFRTTVASPSGTVTVEHGAAILATGAEELKPNEYLYGEHPAVVTGLEMDQLIDDENGPLSAAGDIVFIQCVGSRENARAYCSKVCCTHSIQSALAIKARNPEANVFVLYRDIRTYGRRESLYNEARRAGVLFFRYSAGDKPHVTEKGRQVRVAFTDPLLNRRFSVDADLLCLAAAVVPRSVGGLAQKFKVPVDADGWLLEAHQKLRPVDVATDGVFLCGMAHYPKPVDESIAQAMAAAARAVACLSAEGISVGGVVSVIDERDCTGCGACLAVCPYGAITLHDERRTAEINPALCKGCGACAAACPSEAPVLMGFTHAQLYAQIRGALAA
ncbi:MAG: FAD-dependent oxidoreductase, partial [Desulfobacterales bacterium]